VARWRQDILAGLFADAIRVAGPSATTVDCLAAALESVTVVFTPERHDVAPQRRAYLGFDSAVYDCSRLRLGGRIYLIGNSAVGQCFLLRVIRTRRAAKRSRSAATGLWTGGTTLRQLREPGTVDQMDSVGGPGPVLAFNAWQTWQGSRTLNRSVTCERRSPTAITAISATTSPQRDVRQETRLREPPVADRRTQADWFGID
jgi:hypothetical protein